MENTENKKIVLAQQGGIVVTALATLALASIRIFKELHSTPDTDTTE